MKPFIVLTGRANVRSSSIVKGEEAKKMFYGGLKKIGVVFVSAAIVIFLFQGISFAKSPIVSCTGIIKVTQPDGKSLIIKKSEPLPRVPSGSIVEVFSGSMVIEPDEGFIQVIIGGSAAIVKTGERVKAGMDPVTEVADFDVVKGAISIVTGNTTIRVKTGQEVKIGLDKKTGTAEVRSIKGTIETVTVGIKVLISDGAAAKISADTGTKDVYVESVRGDVVVTSIEGKIIMLAKAESISTKGSIEGEIQTFAEEAAVEFIPVEEPSEPEAPEASPYRP